MKLTRVKLTPIKITRVINTSEIMTQELINELNRTQAMESGKDLAFPLHTGSGYPNLGMTKREYMATQIMSGLITNGYSPEDAAERAIRGVDLLLIQLNKKQ
jgi:hypothetical protein